MAEALTYARLSTKPHNYECSTRGRAVVARRAHNPEVVGSNPTPATKTLTKQDKLNLVVDLLFYKSLMSFRQIQKEVFMIEFRVTHIHISSYHSYSGPDSTLEEMKFYERAVEL